MSDFEIRPLTADHRQAAEAFAAKIPHGDRAFVDRSLLSQVSVAGWTRQSTARRTGEAMLRDHVVDGDGQPGNLCVLSRFLDEPPS